MIAGLLGAGAGALGLFYVAFYAAAFRDVRRARERGEVDTTPFGPMKRFASRALGANPDASYLYVAYTLRDDEEAILTGVLPEAPYVSLTVYDPYLQSQDPRIGPTHLRRDQLLAKDGRFEVVLGHRPCPPPLLDVSSAPEGVLILRILGGRFPDEAPVLERRPAQSAPLPTAPAPALPTWRPLGHLASVRHNPLQLFLRARDHGRITRLRFGPRSMFVISDPEAIHDVLVRAADRFDHQIPSTQPLRRVMGDGLVTLDGQVWRQHRRMAQNAFHRTRIRAFAASMASLSQRFVDGWRDERVVDVAAVMSDLALEVAASTLLSHDIRSAADRLHSAVNLLFPHLLRLTTNPLPFAGDLPTPSNARFRSALRELDQIMYDVIRDRRSHPGDHDDLLAMWMEARDENGVALSDREVRDEITTMLLAGHETVANVLAWALFCLGSNPEICHHVQAEVDELDLNELTADTLSRAPLLGRVINETLRLFPGVFLIGRRAILDTVLGGHLVPKGSMIGMCIYGIHRDPQIWSNPETFDPDRWLPDRQKPPRGAFLPFGGGARRCIGDRFAELELYVVLAHLLRHLTPEPTGPQPALSANISLRPVGGLPMRLRRRDALQVIG